MIPTFEQVMELTDTISIHTVFSHPECRAYYDLIAQLDSTKTMCEIGVQEGRSSSVALQLQPHLHFTYLAVDPFVDGLDTFAKWKDMTYRIDPRPELELHVKQSVEMVYPPLDLLLIDGDHTYQGILTDTLIAKENVRSGGIVLIHDYGWSSTLDVKTVVDRHLSGWENLGTVDTLNIRRRP